jgi:menaquinone-dependent protoporphyrinogen oxidase
MNQKILVAYATKLGSTAEVAQVIGGELRKPGTAVDVLEISQVDSLDAYQSVVVGSAIRVGKWLPEAVKFVKHHRDVLSRIPVAYFVVCMTLSEDTPENRKKVLAYLDPVRQQVPEVRPVDIGLFAGKIDMKELSLPLRFVVKMVKSPVGDFRNWDAVRSWAQQIHPALEAAPTMPATTI